MEALGLPDPWEWEMKLLLQEEEYYEAKLLGIDSQVQNELNEIYGVITDDPLPKSDEEIMSDEETTK